MTANYQPGVQCPRCEKDKEDSVAHGEAFLADPLTMVFCHPHSGRGRINKCEVPYAHLHVSCPLCGWTYEMLPKPIEPQEEPKATRAERMPFRCHCCGRRMVQDDRFCEYCRQ